MTKIVVRGRGPFPLDMLRFSEAWPADGESVARIHNSIGREAIGEFGPVGDIALYTTSLLPAVLASRHLLMRWESFGWHAYVIDNELVWCTTDVEQRLGEPLRPAPEPKAKPTFNDDAMAAVREFAKGTGLEK